MANNKISLKLDGIVPLELYNEAVNRFTAFVMALTEEISGLNSVQWTVTELRAGSAYSEVTGYADPMEDVQRVVEGTKIVWQSLEARRPVPYSDDVVKEAIGLTAILNGKITAVHVGVDDDVIATVNQPIEYEQQKKLDIRDFGTVEGIAASIADRPKLVIGLYDDVFGKRVECALDAEMAERARDIWRKRVRISGMIKRNPDTGLAINVTGVTKIELTEIAEGGFLAARGILAFGLNVELPEVTIRRIRDGS